MSHPVVFGLSTTSTTFNGERVLVRWGEAWYADDPFVRSRPDLFSSEHPQPRGRIEQATAAPGESKRVARPRSTSRA